MDTATATALYARKTAGFDERVESARRPARARRRRRTPGRIVQASSLGAEDQVLTDLIARDRLPIAVATLDTGMLHGETLAADRRASASATTFASSATARCTRR